MNNFNLLKTLSTIKTKLWSTNFRQTFFIAIFSLILILPALQQVTNFFDYPALDEKRKKASFPDYKLVNVMNGKYFSDLEMYFQDHFGFRDLLIEQVNKANYEIFQQATTPDLIVGKEGWLYWHNDRSDYEKKHMTAREIDLVVSKLENFSKQLESQGIEFIFMISPNKATIYPEYMPGNIEKGGNQEFSNYELLDQKLKEHNLIHYIDLRPYLLASKPQFLVYPKNDSHWTQMGTYSILPPIMDKFSEITGIGSELPALDFTQAVEYDKTVGGEGDLQKLQGIYGVTRWQDIPSPGITFPVIIEKYPKTIWYRSSFSLKFQRFIDPYFDNLQFHHLNREPMKKTLKNDLPETKIVVFETVERWLS